MGLLNAFVSVLGIGAVVAQSETCQDWFYYEDGKKEQGLKACFLGPTRTLAGRPDAQLVRNPTRLSLVVDLVRISRYFSLPGAIKFPGALKKVVTVAVTKNQQEEAHIDVLRVRAIASELGLRVI